MADRRDEGSIQRHQETCDFCIESRQEKEKLQKLKLDGYAKMRYILHTINSAKKDIETDKRIIEDQKEKLEEAKKRKAKVQELTGGLLLEEGDDLLERHDRVIRTCEHEIEVAEYDLRHAEATIKKEFMEKKRLLNHENEIVREAAQEIYDNYLKMSDSERRRRFQY